MRLYPVILAAAAVAGLGLSGCGTARNALGMQKVTPDEFRVVTKAPLVVPPDYSLRPPAPGEPRPQELQPDSAARSAMIGQREAEARSDGEKLLVARAGAERSDPLIRYVVDDEFGDLAHKEKSFADRVMFWRKDGSAQPGAVDNTPVDTAGDDEKIKALTGGQQVVIQRQSAPRLKLPGL